MKSKYSIPAILIIVSALVLTKSNGNASPAQYEPSSFLDINPAAYNFGNPSSSYFVGRDSIIDNSGKNKLTNYDRILLIFTNIRDIYWSKSFYKICRCCQLTEERGQHFIGLLNCSRLHQDTIACVCYKWQNIFQ